MLRRIAKNIAIKVPLTPDGLRACHALTDDGAMVNVTLCFSAAQAMLAAKAGATFVSPFVGRLDDIGEHGMGLIADIVQIYRNYPAFKTEVLVASVRSPLHVVEAAQDRRPRRHPAARVCAALQPPADRQGPGRVPDRLGEDRADASRSQGLLFVNKKKQKNFFSLVPGVETRTAQTNKSFLLLFSKKKHFLA